MKKNKILLTGGHGGTTALATAEKLQNRKNVEIIWAGPKYAIEGQKALTYEFKVFPSKGIKCVPIRAGRIQRKFTNKTIASLLKIPLGFVDSFWILKKHKPYLVLSFGGFAAFPVCLMAWIFQIPLIIHEQTTSAGLANRLAGPLASKIALARESSLEYFDKNKSIVLGNPLREVVLKSESPKKLTKEPMIYVTGGSRGSKWINDALEPILPELLKQFSVVHQTGQLQYKHFKNYRNNLSSKARYKVYDFISEEDLPKIFSKSHIVISRAGANTVAEILFLKIPSILIPIPCAQKDEQTQNAHQAVKAGFAKIIKQEELRPESLHKEILEIRENWQKFKFQAFKYKSLDKDAAEKLAELVLEIV